jgi:hypothetical protein
MRDKFLVKNNTNTLLNLPKNRITIVAGGEIELVSRLNKSLADIKRDPEILRELMYNNLILVEEIDNSKQNIETKIDKLFNLVENNKSENNILNSLTIEALEEVLSRKLKEIITNVQPIKESKEGEQDTEIISNEDKMRERLLEQLVNNQKPKDQRLDNLGKEKKIDKSEDFSDIIDF